ncbi:competence type IV pilus minor pilin ComGD [Vagococcus xieshaowenii]|uniref:competence type IV pilus minor pilin ComGD n=1 Tax=Vagococcus xieshaowenii TaxID=2562451 RepID=UPI001075B18D|nr:competence type IV pilus minor pilin ComGD [Vagococcus xieshaowenii]
MESLLVILIVSMTMLLPILAYRRWEHQLVNKQFFSDLENSYHRTQLSAVQNAKGTYLYIDAQEGITCLYYSFGEKKIEELIQVPATIESPSKVSISFKSMSGNVSQANKFYFIDQLNQVKVTYTVQIGSGKLVKKIDVL